MQTKEAPINSWFYYRKYLREWSDSHADLSYCGMSPATYAEWYDNEYQLILEEA